MTNPNDIDDELRFHLESRIRDLMADGLPRPEAAAQAQREFGDRTRIHDQCAGIRRDAGERRKRRHYWNDWRVDLRHGLRAIVRAPLFSIAVISILTVGIALSSSMFAVVHGVFVKPLPYPRAGQLHRVYATNAAKDQRESAMSPGDFFSLRASLPQGIGIGGYMNWPVSLTGVPDPERVRGALASSDLFTTLGINAIEGRTFLPEDEDPASNVAIISARLADRLGIRGRAAGATIELGRLPTVVVGVMPPTFQFTETATDVWIPLALQPADRDSHGARWLNTIARVADDQAAGAEDRLASSMALLAAEFPESNAGWSARLVPLHDTVVSRSGSTILFISLAIACALAVMIVNLIALVTGRLHRRAVALSVHQALGADRWRLLRQVGAECLLMTIIGGTLGLMLTSGFVGVFQRLAGTTVPRAGEVTVSPWIVAFAVVTATIGLVAMTVVPIWRTITIATLPLAPSARGITVGRPSRVLVVVQAALACLLVITAALLAQTYRTLTAVDLGFNADNVLTMRIALPNKTPLPQQAAYFAAVVDRVRNLPGVVTAGAANDLPLSGNGSTIPIVVDNSSVTLASGDQHRAGFRVVTPGYFETIGARARGRVFDDGDAAGRPAVAMVNDSFARTHWPGEDAIGKRVRTSEDRGWRTVVGVAADIRFAGPTVEEGPAIYVPHAQKSEAFMTWMTVAIRTVNAPLTLAPSVRTAIAAIDRYQPVSDVRELSDLVAAAVALPRLAASIAAVAAVASLILAGLGIASVLALLVSARTPDYAVRLALGAPPARLKWSPVIECVMLVTVGGTFGVAAAALLARLMRSLLFGVSPFDWPTFAASIGAMMVLAVLVAIGPARAIGRIDPAMTLRS
jgi:putative ABC transport system permease protein